MWIRETTSFHSRHQAYLVCYGEFSLLKPLTNQLRPLGYHFIISGIIITPPFHMLFLISYTTGTTGTMKTINVTGIIYQHKQKLRKC